MLNVQLSTLNSDTASRVFGNQLLALNYQLFVVAA
jgi:hypothetical protein